MKSIQLLFLICFVSLFLISCDPAKKVNNSDDHKIEVILLQTNDVYEIAPLEGGKVGGMARVARIKQDLVAKNPNTYSLLAGDFLNPSVIGTLKYNGERIRGKQMIEAMNIAGIDLVTFGNHEFDLDEADLQKRIDESTFNWTCSNVRQKNGNILKPFQQNGKDIPDYWIQEFKDSDGTTIKIGFIGLCLNSNKKNYVHYDDAHTSFIKIYQNLKNKVDIVIGLTHQSIENDKKLAEQVQDIPLFIGGHEHNNMKHQVGNVSITKADANAKTAYIHTLKYNTKTKKLNLQSTLKKVDESIPFEPKTKVVVDKWTKIAYDRLEESGIEPNKVIIKLTETIDATDHITRHQPTVIGKIVVNAAGTAYPKSDAAIVNTGSMRLDDLLSGTITQYDIVRLLPFGGGVELVEMKGSLLTKIVEIGLIENQGKGGYLALDRIFFDEKTNIIKVGNETVVPDQIYKIAMPSFLLTGLETNLGFLTPTNEGIMNITAPSTEEQKDIRIAVINWLEKNPIPKL